VTTTTLPPRAREAPDSAAPGKSPLAAQPTGGGPKAAPPRSDGRDPQTPRRRRRSRVYAAGARTSHRGELTGCSGSSRAGGARSRKIYGRLGRDASAGSPSRPRPRWERARPAPLRFRDVQRPDQRFCPRRVDAEAVARPRAPANHETMGRNGGSRRPSSGAVCSVPVRDCGGSGAIGRMTNGRDTPRTPRARWRPWCSRRRARWASCCATGRHAARRERGQAVVLRFEARETGLITMENRTLPRQSSRKVPAKRSVARVAGLIPRP